MPMQPTPGPNGPLLCFSRCLTTSPPGVVSNGGALRPQKPGALVCNNSVSVTSFDLSLWCGVMSVTSLDLSLWCGVSDVTQPVAGA